MELYHLKIYIDDLLHRAVAGSGSTLRACAELNRSCYGFEIKREFVKKAKEQMLTNIQVQTSMFSELEL